MEMVIIAPGAITAGCPSVSMRRQSVFTLCVFSETIPEVLWEPDIADHIV